jgi:hypothetical protein
MSEKAVSIETLKEAVHSYIQFVRTGYHVDRASDYETDVFERAVEAFYGTDIWKEINQKIEEADQ